MTVIKIEDSLKSQENSQEYVFKVIEILKRVQESNRFLMQAMTLCNELSGFLKAEQVSLGIIRWNRVQLVAMDHMDEVSEKMGHVRAIEDAMEECLDQGIPVIYPAANEAAYFCRMAGDLARVSGMEQVVVIPLFYDHIPVMAIALEFSSPGVFRLDGLNALRLFTSLVAPRLYEKSLMDQWIGIRIAHEVRSQFSEWLGPERTWLKIAVIGILSVFVFSICFKGQYRLEAPLVLESANRRVITAPYDGYIESVNVLPGDAVVGEKTVLLQLDTKDIRLKIAEMQAERYTFKKQSDLARSEERVAEAQVAIGKEHQAAAQLNLLEDKLARSTVTSPVDGFVRLKDLNYQIGRGVTAGEPLVEIEDMASLKAVVRVAETDVVDLQVGQKSEIIITAFPGSKIRAVVERIVPSAVVVDGRNVFETWLKIDSPPSWLRPAMEGEARIEAGNRRYAWLWFHKVTNWLRMKLWI